MGNDQICTLDKGVILDEIDNILSILRQIPDKGMDFRNSVEDKVKDFRSDLTGYGSITQAQWESLKRMKAGAEKWLR